MKKEGKERLQKKLKNKKSKIFKNAFATYRGEEDFETLAVLLAEV